MPIDFTCSGCANQLRVSDQSAGKDARCPKCGAINRVPSATTPPFSPPSAPAMPERKDNLFGELGDAATSNPFGAASINPYAAPQAASYQPVFTGGPTAVGVEPILNYAWQVWQQNLGLLVGITLVAGIISAVFQFALQFGQVIVSQNGGKDLAPLMSIAAWFANMAVQVFFLIGELTIAFKLIRRQNADFGDLFSGGSLFLPAYVVYLLYFVAVVVGTVLLIVPGILVALALWPALYVVVDRKLGIGESLSTAMTITKGNWGTAFLLGLLTFAIILVGFLAFCIGLIFAAPLVLVLWATAYLMMSGQIPAYSQPQPQFPAYK